jgi:hypothetical protein
MLTERLTKMLNQSLGRVNDAVMKQLGETEDGLERVVQWTVKLVKRVEQKTGDNSLSKIEISDI